MEDNYRTALQYAIIISSKAFVLMIFLRRIIRAFASYTLVALFLLLCFVSPAAHAQNKVAAIAQGFKTHKTGLSVGALVSLDPNDATYVELATEDNKAQLAGVVGDKALIELANDSEQTQVVTSGVAYVLVCDINGAIKNGDTITASPISGVGMKAIESTIVVGTAQADMSSVTNSNRTIKTTDGTNQAVKIASIPAQINVAQYVEPGSSRSFLPEPLQLFANSVAGREVSPVRVAIAGLVLLLASVSIAVLLYAAVRSSIISIGRNPLSEVAVRKSLFQVGLTIGGILLLTVIAIYLILIT